MSEFAAIADNTEILESPRSVANLAELETPRVLFYAMDTITDIEKRQVTYKQFGRIHLPQVQLLNKGMLYRCQLTRLPKYKHIPDWRNMLGPHPSVPHEDSFVQTVIENGVAKETEVKGFLGSDPSAELKEAGEFRNKRSNHVVYRKRYAAQDVALAVRRGSMGKHAPGGVVEITALKGASPSEVKAVQMFFFPEWDEIKVGVKELPFTVSETEAHIKGRISQINVQSWDDAKKAKYHEIGKDMLTSCSEFRRRAVDAIKADEIIVKDAAQKGASGTIVHSDMSDKYLEQTNTRRKEDLVSGQSDSVTELAREMRAEREAKAETSAKMLLLEERKQYTAEIAAGLRERDAVEEVRLGIRKAEPVLDLGNGVMGVPVEIIEHPTQEQLDEFAEDIAPPTDYHVPSEDEPQLPTMAEAGIRLCGQPTASGGTCPRTLKDGEAACFQHGK